MSLLIHPKRGPKGSYVGKIHSVAYNRNGVCGEGFWRVEFDSESDRLIGLVTMADNDEHKLKEAYVVHATDPLRAFRGTDRFGEDLMRVINGSRWPHDMKPEEMSVPELA